MTENKKTIGKDKGGVKMTHVRVESFSISLDGYGAGPDQSVDNPLGIGGEDMHDWVISTRSWRQMHGKEGGMEGIDDDFAVRGTQNIGAWILGRNMFGPIRGPLAGHPKGSKKSIWLSSGINDCESPGIEDLALRPASLQDFFGMLILYYYYFHPQKYLTNARFKVR